MESRSTVVMTGATCGSAFATHISRDDGKAHIVFVYLTATLSALDNEDSHKPTILFAELLSRSAVMLWLASL